MVPAAFVLMDALPLTPNDKVDYRKLPAPDMASNTDGESFVGPRTPFEEILMELWCDVLGLNKVGINQNFFEVGGHSLLATQLVSRVRTALDVEIPLSRVFETPTIEGLAQAVEAKRHGQAVSYTHLTLPTKA